MELSFSELRTKEVVNTNDGRRLGKVCDIVFCYPENRVIGIVVPGCKGFAFWKSEQFIDMKNIVNCNPPPPPPGGPGMGGPGPSYPPSGGYPSQPQYPGRRSYEEYE